MQRTLENIAKDLHDLPMDSFQDHVLLAKHLQREMQKQPPVLALNRGAMSQVFEDMPYTWALFETTNRGLSMH